MNSNQFPKDVYQTPSSQSGEAFGVASEKIETPQPSLISKKEAYALEREAVLRTFNSEPVIIPVEISPAQTIRTEMLGIGQALKAYRAEQHAEFIERSKPKNKIGRLLMPLIYNGTSEAANLKVEKSIDTESKIGGSIFTKPSDVTSIKFFYLPEHNPAMNQEIDIWHYSQESLDRIKNFTNSYKITENHIEKSSTFYDERIGSIVNRSSIPGALEMHNLLVASKKYYTSVTEKSYIKSAAPRFRFGSKSDHDLAA